MSDFGIVTLVLLVFVFVTIAKGVRIIPQGEEWIVEGLGKYNDTLLPGLRIIIPYLDNVADKLVTKDIILDVQEQEVITKDNAVILTNARIENRLPRIDLASGQFKEHPAQRVAELALE